MHLCNVKNFLKEKESFKIIKYEKCIAIIFP